LGQLVQKVGEANFEFYRHARSEFTDPNAGVTGSMSLVNGRGIDYALILSADGNFVFDNLFYPYGNAPGTTGGIFDYGGLFFNVGPPENPTEWKVNFWANSLISIRPLDYEFPLSPNPAPPAVLRGVSGFPLVTGMPGL